MIRCVFKIQNSRTQKLNFKFQYIPFRNLIELDINEKCFIFITNEVVAR